MGVTKHEFINRLAKKGKITKMEAEWEVNLFIETLMDCILEDGIVKLQGFGKFEVKTAKERIGRNPKNGKEYIIPEHQKLKFSEGETISKLINKNN